MSCNKKTVEQELSSLQCGEKTTITDQDFCNHFLNAGSTVNFITFEKTKYKIKRKGSLIKGISGYLDYTMSDGEKEFDVSIVSNESSLMPLSAIVERIH